MENKKYKIGYTAGVFDLFHIGHLNLIKGAKSLCDYLIVGVNADELVMEYKKKTPIILLHERLAIVESIRYVDKVVVQTSLDKLQAWERLKYDVLFIGDDWKGSLRYIETEEQLKSVDVDLIYLPYTHSVSSSILIEKLYELL